MVEEGKDPKPPEISSEQPETTGKKAEKKSMTIEGKNAKVEHDANDEEMCKKIVGVLAEEKAKRVLLKGKAGIGKTRLAKLVGQYAINHDLSFLTLCLHLNQEFKADKLNLEDDKLTTDEKTTLKLKGRQYALYQNIASQISVYSDFEETEVDDRDEDEEEEKTLDTLLTELKKKIVEEINKREEAAKIKRKVGEAMGKKNSVGEGFMAKHKKWFHHQSKKDEKPGKTAVEDPPATVVTSAAGGEKKVTPKRYIVLILDDEGNKTKEEVVMKELGLAKFLKDNILSDDDTRLKIIVTKREEPRESNDTNSEQGKEEDKDAKTGNEIEPDQGDAKATVAGNGVATAGDGKGVPPKKLYDLFEYKFSDQSLVLSESINEETLGNIFLSLISEEWKTDEKFIARMVKNSEMSPAAIVVLAKSLNQITRRTFSELKEKILAVITRAEAGSSSEDPILQLADELFGPSDSRVIISDNPLNSTSHATKLLSLPEEWKTDENFMGAIVERSSKSPAVPDSLKQLSERAFRDLKNKIEEEINKLIPPYHSAPPKEVIPTAQPEPTDEIVPTTAQLEPSDEIVATTDQPVPTDEIVATTDQPETTDEIVATTDQPEPTEQGSSSESTNNLIFHLAYVLLKKFGPPTSKDAILHCFWHSLDFFAHCGCAYYRELITQWILEGYFDPVRSVEKAYQAGHTILMELINRGMLKIQENNVVVPEMAMSILIDPRLRGHLGSSRLGFSRVYIGDKEKGIGKITQIDDMIKTVQAKKRDEITTILVGGDRLRRVTPGRYFKKLCHLEVLGLFEPTLEPFISALLKINQNELNKSLLRVLVIRDCDLLDNIEELKNLPALNALEVSGASSLKKITDDFFKDLPKLESLHLSELQITSSPSSISDLMELHCLIIRDCPLLEDLPDIQKLEKLEVVDVSGARGLQTCFDNTKGEKKNKSKNKNFYMLKQLQVLDFSESQIERLPIFQDSAAPEKLHKVTRLLLRNCSKLRRLPSLKPLSGLQILDLSGTSNLVEMLEVCFEDKKELKTLNLSGTNLAELADTINELESLNELLLKNATKLETIPKIDDLEKLEVFDVSGSTKLKKMDGSFEKMHYLREVDLSGTVIEAIPNLPTKSKMCCEKLITLPDGRKFKGAKWKDIEAKIPKSKTPEEASTSEISEKKPEEVVEIQPSEEVVEIQPSEEVVASDGSEKIDVSKERLLQVPKEKTLYTKTLSLVDPTFCQDPEGMEINGTNAIDWNALEKAKFVYFVDITSTMLPSIFEKAKSMEGCWLRFCIDIKDLFAGVAADHLESLVNLYITNLPSLEIISSGGNLKNLKNITIEYCPIIKTLFPDAPPKPVPVPEPAKKSSSVPEPAQKPTVPEVVEIKHLDSLETLSIRNLPLLETISRGASLNNLKKLNVGYCPKIKTLFREAAQMPSSLEVVDLKHCDTVEKIVEVGEAPAGLRVVIENCAKFKGNYEEISEEISEEIRDTAVVRA